MNVKYSFSIAACFLILGCMNTQADRTKVSNIPSANTQATQNNDLSKKHFNDDLFNQAIVSDTSLFSLSPEQTKEFDAVPVYEKHGNILLLSTHVRTRVYGPKPNKQEGISFVSRPYVTIDYFPSDGDVRGDMLSHDDFFGHVSSQYGRTIIN